MDSTAPTPVRRLYQTWVAAILVCGCAASVFAQSPVSRFISRVEQDAAIPAAAATLIRSTWNECEDCDAHEFLMQGLAVLSRKFRAGLDAYDAERYEVCVAIMGELRADDDVFVATHAAAYEIKALVAQERMLEALKLIEQLPGGKNSESGPLATYTYLAPEMAFMRGLCLLADLRYKEATTTLRRFLRVHPGAPPRLVFAAEQMLTELRSRLPGQIGEVVDLMNFSGRRLRGGHTGEPVQERQERIIELLSKLIKDAEQQEKNQSKGEGGGGGGGGGGSQGGQSPGSPMQRSQLPGGQAQEGPLGGGRRASPAQMWGAMPPAERQRILQALRDNFPSRYRQLVEQYYEELAKKP